MGVAPGSRFGPYAVVAPLGAGGMGEVYRAIDTRLNRPVALKVLGADTVRDPAARERFDREARLIAKLQHPHICVLHDVGYAGDTPYLVMELLAGEILDARLARGRLPLDDALTLGAQIAQALDTAHRQGIVHRDLKPANVMLVRGPAGTDAKLLDFGVARPVEAPRRGDRSDDATGGTGATTAAAITDRHTLVGTLPYMAPEQLAGQAADARTDLWALGCVLYEMLAGTRPFAEPTTATLMAAILEQPPQPLGERAPLTPPFVDHLVRRCLEKDPERRWQSARDLAAELAWARGHAAAKAAASASPAPRRTAWLGWAVAAVVAALAGFGALSRRDPTRPVADVVRLSIPPPDGTVFLGGRAAPYVAVSPDGKRVAIVPTPYGRSASIWVRELDSDVARVIPQTAGATFPFWSPDGTRLGFFADGKLKVADPRGGRPLTLAPAPSPRGGAWNQFGQILFTPALDSGLYVVSAGGGVPTTVTSLNGVRGEINHKFPTFLPDGRRFLFTNQTGSAANTGVYLGGFDSEPRLLLNVASRAQFAGGLLWYSNNGALVAQRVDLATLRPEGAPIPVGQDVAGRNTIVGDAVFSISSNGLAIVWSGPQAATTELVWYDRSGQRLTNLATPDRYFSIALSPDDRTLAVEVPDPEGPFYNIWTIDAATGLRSRVTSGSLNWGPVWSPDGRRLAYGSLRGGPSQVFQRGIDGEPNESHVWGSAEFIGPSSWTADGKSLVLFDATHYRLGLHVIGSSQPPAWFSHEDFVEGDGRVSPDGRWLAYTSNESGTWDVYLKPFPALNRKWRVSLAGGSGPLWRGDSEELYFVDPDQNLMSIRVRQSASPLEGSPTRLFALPIVPTPPGIDTRLMYAASADGRRFIVNTPAEAGSQLPLTVVLNAPSALDGATR